ncbi:hypothetical protein [Sorangium sp. So ce117]|uniref:hypothetical protein n=1 Tax=Sorangium sp. So ce117 TaxID=3133277 RepID=UPI003F5E2796
MSERRVPLLAGSERGLPAVRVAGRRRPTSASGQARAKPHLDPLHATLDVAKAKLHEIAETTDDTWDEVKQGADHV